MSYLNAVLPSPMAVCRGCGNDLAIRTGSAFSDSGQGSDGRVYCTNSGCCFSENPYPIGSDVESGAG